MHKIYLQQKHGLCSSQGRNADLALPRFSQRSSLLVGPQEETMIGNLHGPIILRQFPAG